MAPVYWFAAASVPEELLFRGGLLAVMVAIRTGVRGKWWSLGLQVSAVLVSTLVFASAHADYGMWNMSIAAVSGVLLAVLAVATKSLWPAIVTHGLYDTVVGFG